MRAKLLLDTERLSHHAAILQRLSPRIQSSDKFHTYQLLDGMRRQAHELIAAMREERPITELVSRCAQLEGTAMRLKNLSTQMSEQGDHYFCETVMNLATIVQRKVTVEPAIPGSDKPLALPPMKCLKDIEHILGDLVLHSQHLNKPPVHKMISNIRIWHDKNPGSFMDEAMRLKRMPLLNEQRAPIQAIANEAQQILDNLVNDLEDPDFEPEDYCRAARSQLQDLRASLAGVLRGLNADQQGHDAWLGAMDQVLVGMITHLQADTSQDDAKDLAKCASRMKNKIRNILVQEKILATDFGLESSRPHPKRAELPSTESATKSRSGQPTRAELASDSNSTHKTSAGKLGQS